MAICAHRAHDALWTLAPHSFFCILSYRLVVSFLLTLVMDIHNAADGHHNKVKRQQVLVSLCFWKDFGQFIFTNLIMSLWCLTGC